MPRQNKLIGSIISRARFGLSAVLSRIFSRQVKYLGFSAKDDKAFGDYIGKRLDHPAKRQVLDWLAAESLLPEKFSLLDVGCGPGLLAQMVLRDPKLNKRVTYTGVDQSANAVQYCQKTLPAPYTAQQRDVLADGFPADNYDVIAISEVIEHLPYYDKLLSAVIAKKPRIFALTTFAALPECQKDRLLWRPEKKCYMNTYSFDKLFEYLRKKTGCPIAICDLGTERFDRYWFPKKAMIVWYLKLGAKAGQGKAR